jgi:hypothetical protein
MRIRIRNPDKIYTHNLSLIKDSLGFARAPPVTSLTIAKPQPVDDDKDDLPDDPEEDDLLAELLRAPDKAEIREQADDGRHKGRTCNVQNKSTGTGIANKI